MFYAQNRRLGIARTATHYAGDNNADSGGISTTNADVTLRCHPGLIGKQWRERVFPIRALVARVRKRKRQSTQEKIRRTKRKNTRVSVRHNHL